MALLPAFAVDGGRVPAEMLRMQLWASTAGATGVVKSTDLKVLPLSVPGGAVSIRAGGAIMPSLYSSTSTTQSYAVVNDASATLDIPPTGSASGRVDYIILRVDDWHHDPASQQPSDPLNATYARFIRATNTNLTYPGVVLAKITIPPSTGTITADMITDLREVAVPRTKRVVRVNPQSTSTTETLTVTGVDGEYFPNIGGTQKVDFPSWAPWVTIRADWLGMWQTAGSTCNVWVEFGDWTGSRFEVRTEKFAVNTPNTGTDMRANAVAVGRVWIPPKYRGRNDVTVQMKAQKTAGTTKIDSMSGVALEMVFDEYADTSSEYGG